MNSLSRHMAPVSSWRLLRVTAAETRQQTVSFLSPSATNQDHVARERINGLRKLSYSLSWKRRRSGIKLEPKRTMTTETDSSSENNADDEYYFIECHGDYREESFLEDPKQKLYQHQSTLPSLPIPTIEQTMATFLPTALPLVQTPELQAGGKTSNYTQQVDRAQELVTNLKEACNRFPQQAQHLQQRLLQRQNDMQQSSWLQQWWNQIGYLQCRDSVFHISYFYRLAYDDSCHGDGIARAAAALQATAFYAAGVLAGTKETEVMGRDQRPLCSTQFKYMFNACRIPRETQDCVRIYRRRGPQSSTPFVTLTQAPAHVVVVCRGQFYKFPLLDDEQRIHSVESLATALQECAAQSELSRDDDLRPPELGYLTMADRDACAKGFAVLERQPELQKPLKDLQSALCILALDNTKDDPSNASMESPTETAKRLWHGNLVNSANRWADKSFQLVVSQDGTIGYVGEHSLSDGMPAIGLCVHIMDHGRVQDDNHPDASKVTSMTPKVEPLFREAFRQLDKGAVQEIQAHVDAAKDDLTRRIHDHELHVLTYSDYGSDQMKRAGFSPDAFVQSAIQLAGYQVFGGPVGTYESTQTRAFLHGRTETTRSVSPESKEFVEAMLDLTNRSSLDTETKRDLLKKATDAHSKYTRLALEGMGVDRHFLGLSMVQEDGEKTPDLFTDPLFLVSKRWRISTSTVPRARTGFSQVENDGIGIGYDIQSDSCVLTITGKAASGYAKDMHHCLHKALDSMKDLFAGTPASKL